MGLNKPSGGLIEDFRYVYMVGGEGGESWAPKLALMGYIFGGFQQITFKLGSFYWFKGALSSSVDRFSLTDPCQKFGKKYRGKGLRPSNPHGLTVRLTVLAVNSRCYDLMSPKLIVKQKILKFPDK